MAEEEPLYIDPNEVVDENELWEIKRLQREKIKSVHHSEQEKEVSELQQYHHPTAGTYQAQIWSL